jgi:hypothetical protein
MTLGTIVIGGRSNYWVRAVLQAVSNVTTAARAKS